MMRYTVRPISDRTPFTGLSTDSRFTVTWSGCLEVLERELTMLDATEVVFEVDVAEHGIRMDGQLHGRAKAATPAVRIAFESKHVPLALCEVMGWDWEDLGEQDEPAPIFGCDTRVPSMQQVAHGLADDLAAHPAMLARDAALVQQGRDEVAAAVEAELRAWGGAERLGVRAWDDLLVRFRAAVAAAGASDLATIRADAWDAEALAAQVHEAWMDTKRGQGLTSRPSEWGEEQMVPYADLSERAKDLDRGTVRAVLAAQDRVAAEAGERQ